MRFLRVREPGRRQPHMAPPSLAVTTLPGHSAGSTRVGPHHTVLSRATGVPSLLLPWTDPL